MQNESTAILTGTRPIPIGIIPVQTQFSLITGNN